MKQLILIILLVNSFYAHAVLKRHDIPDEKYQAFAGQFNATVTFYDIWKGKEAVAGTGTLINKNWVLTASHVANVLVKGGKVGANGEFLEIRKIIKHPKWRDGQLPFDIALVQLSAEAKNLMPVKLLRESTEKGKVHIIIGRGDFGNGKVGVVGADKIKRAATNAAFDTEDQWIKFIFDQGENALELEGISGPGDSGGPALIDLDGELFLSGVSSWQNTEPTNWQEGMYGVIENYSRVSYFIDWIDETLSKHSENTETHQNKSK